MARTRVKTDRPLPAEVQGSGQEFERIQDQGAPNGQTVPQTVPQPSGEPTANVPISRGGVFGPTERPLEAPTAGLGVGPGPGNTPTIPDDRRIVARQIYRAFPTAHTLNLATGD